MEEQTQTYRTSKNLLEAVLAKSLECSGCNLIDGLIEEIVRINLEEVEAVSRYARMNIDDLRHVDVSQVVREISNKKQKFSFKCSTSIRGRHKDIQVAYDADEITLRPQVDVHTGFTQFLLSDDNKFCKTSCNRAMARDFFTQNSTLKKYLDVNNLMRAGVMKETMYIFSKGIANRTTEETSFSIYGSANNLHIQPIRVKFFAHDPSKLDFKPGSLYDKAKFTLHWMNDAGTVFVSVFTYIKPKAVRVTFRAEIEFHAAQQSNPTTFFCVVSFGILPALFNASNTKEWTCESFEVTLTVHEPSSWFCTKDKTKIDITLDQVNEYLQCLKDLSRIKARLGKTEELKQLTDDTSKEAVDINHSIQIESMMNQLKNSGLLNPNSEAAGDVLPTSAELEAILNYLRYYSFLDPEIIQSSILDAILQASKQNYKLFDRYETYARLLQNNQDHNAILGLMFEEIVSGKIMHEANLKGIQLDRIAGDGKGLIREGLPTPEYADLIFRDQNGKYYAYQLKCSGKEENIKQLIETFYSKHRGNTKQHTYPPGLKLEDIQIIVPDGMNVGPVEVVLKDPVTGQDVKKTVTPSSDIKLGDVKLKSPSQTEASSHLKSYFDEVKKSMKMFEDMAEKLRLANQKAGEVSEHSKRIDALEKTIQKKKQEGVKEEHIRTMQEKLDKLNEDLRETQESLVRLKKDAEDVQQNIEKSIKESQQRLEREEMKIKLKKSLYIQIAIGALVDGVIGLVQSLDRNIRAYNRKEITGMELATRVVKDTGLSIIKGQIVSLPVMLSFYWLQRMSLSTSVVWATTGSIAAKVLGPLLIVGALGYETYCIMDLHKNKEITDGEKNKLLGRMVCKNAFMIGSNIGIALMVGTGPAGLLLGAGATIAVALGDYFFGAKVFDAIFGSDLESTHDELKVVTLEKAYALFNLTKHCTDTELKEAYREAVRKYHPDKSTGDKEKNLEITRAVITAYAMLKEERKMT